MKLNNVIDVDEEDPPEFRIWFYFNAVTHAQWTEYQDTPRHVVKRVIDKVADTYKKGATSFFEIMLTKAIARALGSDI